MPDSEFVTVAEASRALQLSERQVRRYASQLMPTDKRQDANRQHKGQPLALVRLLALESLQKSEFVEGKPTGKTNGHASGMPVESSGVPVAVAPVELLGRLSEAEKRAAVLEAERDGLIARLADTASDRDAWKEQAGKLDSRLAEALEALHLAQNSERSARLIGQRPASMLSALETPGGSQGSPDVPGGVIDRPETVKAPWWAFWKGRG